MNALIFLITAIKGGIFMYKLSNNSSLSVIIFLILLMITFIIPVSAADSVDEKNDFLITAKNLNEKILKQENKLRIIDIRSSVEYLRGHLPQAVHMTEEDFTKPDAWVDGLIPNPKDFSNILKEKGINNNSEIIIYGNEKSYHPYRLKFILYFYGHQNAKILEGGFKAWDRSEFEIKHLPFKAKEGNFVVKKVNNNLVVTTNTIANKLNNRNLVILDNRNNSEFQGKEKTNLALRKGRIPGSINLDWNENFDENNELLKNEKLLNKYEKIGVNKNKTIILLSNKSFKAAQTFFLLKSLGYNDLKLYDEGWLGWSKHNNLPIEFD